MTAPTLHEFMAGLGYDLPANYTTNRIERFNAPDKPKVNRSAWLIVFSNGSAVFGNWSTAEQHVYSRSGERLPIAEYIKLKREVQAQRKQQKANQLKGYIRAGSEAQAIINNATPSPALTIPI